MFLNKVQISERLQAGGRFWKLPERLLPIDLSELLLKSLLKISSSKKGVSEESIGGAL